MYKGYKFYFDKLLLPVAPPKLELKINNNNETVDLANNSQVNLLKDPGLTDITFEVLIPVLNYYPFARYEENSTEEFYDWANEHGYRMENVTLYNQDQDRAFLADTRNVTPATPEYFLEFFEQLKTKCAPFQFIVLRDRPSGALLWDTNMSVSMEDYTVTEDAEDGDDIKVSFNLKQYRGYEMKYLKVSQTTTTEQKATVEAKRDTSQKPSVSNTTYTVVSGDTLWGISKSKYGDGEQWQKIYDANKKTIEDTAKKYGKASSSNGHWIYPGEKLVIP